MSHIVYLKFKKEARWREHLSYLDILDLWYSEKWSNAEYFHMRLWKTEHNGIAFLFRKTHHMQFWTDVKPPLHYNELHSTKPAW